MKGECHICHRYGYVERHHVFGGPNRKLSEKYDIVYTLCPDCHRNGQHAVHRDWKANLALKREGEVKWMEDTGLGVQDFIKVFGKNYLY